MTARSPPTICQITSYNEPKALSGFAGAAVWGMGDILLAVVILPNLLALCLLAPKVVEMTNDYFDRKPWVANQQKREQWKREGRKL